MNPIHLTVVEIKALEERPAAIVVLPYVQPVVIREIPIWPYPYQPSITWCDNTAMTCLS